MEKSWLVDIEPVLRHFGATKKLARKRYELFVKAGMKLRRREEFYKAVEGRICGTEEFVERTKVRVGEIAVARRAQLKNRSAPDLQKLVEAVAQISSLTAEEICSRGKSTTIVMAKEAIVIVGHELGAGNAALARLIGIDNSTVSRRFESGKNRMKKCKEMQKVVMEIRMLVSKAPEN